MTFSKLYEITLFAFLIFFALSMSPQSLWASEIELKQEKTITGSVKDEAGQPLIGATVQLIGSLVGTVTDIDGETRKTIMKLVFQLRKKHSDFLI